MLFSKVLFASALSATAFAQVSTIISDLNAIGSATSALTSALTSYKGGVAAGVPILSATNKVEAATKQAISDASALPSGASDSDQASVLKAAEALYPLIIKSLQAFVADIPKFKAAGLTSTADSSLSTLSSQSAQLSSALAGKASGAYATAAQQIGTLIKNAFASAAAGTSPQAGTLPSIPSSGGSSGGSSAASSAAASSATGKAPTYGSSSAAAATTPAATPTAAASSAAASAPAAASSAAPAPQYTGAANKLAGSIGGAFVVAAAAFAL